MEGKAKGKWAKEIGGRGNGRRNIHGGVNGGRRKGKGKMIREALCKQRFITRPVNKSDVKTDEALIYTLKSTCCCIAWDQRTNSHRTNELMTRTDRRMIVRGHRAANHLKTPSLWALDWHWNTSTVTSYWPFQRQRCPLVTLCHPGLTDIFNFWHADTLALSPERQSVRMSEIKNGRLDLDSIEHFYKCNYLTSLHFKVVVVGLVVLFNLVVVRPNSAIEQDNSK